ncbi:MAG TPA: class I SAM-dependent methyltransferase [Solirubrobacteraceae bacterium]|jgi:predicted O-methyltransferase YrrM
MDSERFIAELSGRFHDFPNSDRPRGPRFDDIISAVENLSTENTLVLLNCAASNLASGESYVEVGSYMGASLIGAMRGNEDRDFVAIDGFTWANRESFDANLERFGATAATIIEGDAFEVLESARLDGRRIGTLFWDADHSREGQLRALRDVEARLAPGALVICDNADRPAVGDAIEDWLLEQPLAASLLELGGRTRGQPWWHDGIRVLRWD